MHSVTSNKMFNHASHFFLVFLLIFSTPVQVSSQELSTKTIELPNFKTVTLDTIGNFYLIPDSKHRIVIEAEPKLISKFSAKVVDGKLKVFANSNFSTDKAINIKVYLPVLNKLVTQSSGDIQLDGFQVDDLDLIVSGSGTVKATGIKVKRLKIRLDGASDIEISGSAASLDISNDGAGEFEAGDFIVSNAIASLQGSGDIKLHVLDNLNASIKGSGTITYKGNPKLVSTIDGVGEINKQ